MCLALPAKVVELDGAESAVVELGGVRQKVNLGLVEEVRLGDFLIIHVGYALTKLDPVEAEKTLSLMRSEAVPQKEPADALRG